MWEEGTEVPNKQSYGFPVAMTIIIIIILIIITIIIICVRYYL